MPFKIVRNDIVKMETQAIVNAANKSLQMGGGVCGAIFKAAGPNKLQRACDKIGGCEVGQAVITEAYDLYADYIIHTVGPIWRDGNNDEEELLYSAYKSSLDLARENQIESIAFPLISSGIYGYPRDQALKVAIAAISDFLLEHDMEVYLVVYGGETVLLSEKLFDKIDRYIDNNYIEKTSRILESYELQKSIEEDSYPGMLAENIETKTRNLEELIVNQEETFSQMLLRLIDQKNMTDVETYKKANVDRRLFSKIKNNKEYNPSKPTAIAFAIALELNLDETCDLLQRAGYALSPSNKFDLIIEFFIEESNYDIYEINQALFSFDQSLLGL